MYSAAECNDFIAIIKGHGTIKRGRLLIKMHIAGHKNIKDRDLRGLKEYINDYSPSVLLGSGQTGYFIVNTQAQYEEALAQIENQALDLMRKRSLLTKKYAMLNPQYNPQMTIPGVQ